MIQAQHECPQCGMVCDCDGEDTWNEPPANCGCCCDEDDYDDDPLEPDFDPEEDEE